MNIGSAKPPLSSPPMAGQLSVDPRGYWIYKGWPGRGRRCRAQDCRAGARRCRGLTLIELLVALAVVSVIALLSYRGLGQAQFAQARLSEELQRWRAIGRLLQRLETDLAGIARRPAPLPAEAVSGLQLTRLEDGRQVLRLLRIDGAEGGSGWIGYLPADGQLELLRPPADGMAQPPRRDALLAEVRAVRWTALATDGRRHERWPLATGTGTLPAGLELQLELADVGTLVKLFPLR